MPSSPPCAQLRTGAGTHNRRCLWCASVSATPTLNDDPRRMGPCVRRDDSQMDHEYAALDASLPSGAGCRGGARRCGNCWRRCRSSAVCCCRRSSSPSRSMSAARSSTGSRTGVIWKHLAITLWESILAFAIGSFRRRCGRLLVRAQAAGRRGVRPLCQDGQRAAARGAGADLHAVARARHLVEGRARRHAGVLHRVLQRLSGRQGSLDHDTRQRAACSA